MKIWALADLHLSLGNPASSMEVFGPAWKNYPQKIQANWKKTVDPDDLVLIAGDISWAMKPAQALIDLDFIDALPGEKLIIRGNHDYWWSSSAKLKGLLPPSIHFIHNSAYHWNGIAFSGARLWDTHEYNFSPFIHFVENPFQKKKKEPSAEETERIFTRELERLKLSLSQIDPKTKKRIALTHYPPIAANLTPSRAATLLEDYQIDICVFGHLHNVKKDSLPFGKARGVQYRLTSADYLDFTPILILE